MIHSEIKISKSGNRLILEIPQGMTGTQLIRWKQKNKALIESAKESADGLVAVVTIAEEIQTLPQETPKSIETEMFHEEQIDSLVELAQETNLLSTDFVSLEKTKQSNDFNNRADAMLKRKSKNSI